MTRKNSLPGSRAALETILIDKRTAWSRRRIVEYSVYSVQQAGGSAAYAACRKYSVQRGTQSSPEEGAVGVNPPSMQV